jgi:hypothetical protein
MARTLIRTRTGVRGALGLGVLAVSLSTDLDGQTAVVDQVA